MEFLSNIGIFTICFAVVYGYKKIKEAYTLNQPYEYKDDHKKLHIENDEPTRRDSE